MRQFLAYALVISLGLILVITFFKPWLPDLFSGFGFDAYEPNMAFRIIEGVSGIAILGFGIERVIANLRGE